MGEANRRGSFEDRKRQAIHSEEYTEAERKVIAADKLAASAAQGTSSTRSKVSLNLAVSAMMAASFFGGRKL